MPQMSPPPFEELEILLREVLHVPPAKLQLAMSTPWLKFYSDVSPWRYQEQSTSTVHDPLPHSFTDEARSDQHLPSLLRTFVCREEPAIER